MAGGEPSHANMYASQIHQQHSDQHFEQSDSNYFKVDELDLPYFEKFNKLLFQRPGSRALSVPSYFPFATVNQFTSMNLKEDAELAAAAAAAGGGSGTEMGGKQPRLSNAAVASNSSDVFKLKRLETNENLKSGDAKSKSSRRHSRHKSSGKTAPTVDSKTTTDVDLAPQLANLIHSDQMDEEDDIEDNNTDGVVDLDDADAEDDDDVDDANGGTGGGGANVAFNGNSPIKVVKGKQQYVGASDEFSLMNKTDYLTQSFVVHASINQYKMKFLGSV